MKEFEISFEALKESKGNVSIQQKFDSTLTEDDTSVIAGILEKKLADNLAKTTEKPQYIAPNKEVL